MLINEVCKEAKLTKKAIEYYEEQQLIQPELLENGYRNFTINDVERLKKIAVLRKLGLSIPEIRTALKEENTAALFQISAKKSLEIEILKSKQELVQMLSCNRDWNDIQIKLEALEQKQTILERFLDAFPGSYGKYLSLHFGLYLNEPIINKGQQEAFDIIISFLDRIDFKIPVDLQEYLDEITKDFDANIVTNISENMNKAVQEPEKYITENQEILEQYIALKQSEEYKKSLAYRLQEFFAKFNQESGYYDIFIPAMKKLSKSYRDYQEAIKKANKVFIEKYPSKATHSDTLS